MQVQRTCIVSQVSGTIGIMADHMNGTIAAVNMETKLCGVELTVTDGISAAVLLTLIPLLDLIVVPLLGYANPGILKRLGLGASLAFLSMLTLLLMEGIGKHTSGDQVCMFNVAESAQGKLEISVYWVILPLLIVIVAEIFIYIPCKHSEIH